MHLSLLAALATPFASLVAQSQSAPVWHTDLAAATRLAAERHAPLFVTFRCER